MSSSKWWVKIKKCQAKKRNNTSYKLKVENEIIKEDLHIAEAFANRMKNTLNETTDIFFNSDSKKK
jgi:hypothetical protein